MQGQPFIEVLNFRYNFTGHFKNGKSHTITMAQLKGNMTHNFHFHVMKFHYFFHLSLAYSPKQFGGNIGHELLPVPFHLPL